MKNHSSYRQILKSTSIFGGVQIFNIFIGIIRLKFIALLLGPSGMGIVGLLTSTTGMITGMTNFGLGTSAIKNVAEADALQDKKRINIVVNTLRRLVWFTGLLGTFITLFFSQWLSKITFGNGNYTYSFIFLSVTLLFNQLSVGQNVILQGSRRLKYLAKSNILSNLFGLIVTLPLYYFWRINGIVPALVITSIVTLSLSWYFSSKVLIIKVRLKMKEIWKEGKGMLTMGFMMSLSSIITSAVSYITRIYIGREDGIIQVGLYTAGFTIIGSYVGLIFTGISTDYYPRLSRVAHDNILAKSTINQQAEIALLILAPILMVFFIFINYLIKVLYSNQFLSVNGMIQWAALGMFFKTASWTIAFLFLAKGASKVFFINELIANVYILLFNILCYNAWGMAGLGISFLIVYVIYLVQVSIICYKKYDFILSKDFLKIFFLQLFCGCICFCVVKFISIPYQYLFGCIFIILSMIYSLIELDKRLNLRGLFIK